MKRRTFVAVLPCLLAGFAWPGGARSRPSAPRTAEPPSQPLEEALVRLFSRPADARAVGACYLRDYPERCDRRRLLAEVGLDPPPASVRDGSSLRRHLRELQQRDFVDGNTVVVNRWILARTEASLCALVTLS
jgi:hypothetical protein